jgi:hypothetical protein
LRIAQHPFKGLANAWIGAIAYCIVKQIVRYTNAVAIGSEKTMGGFTALQHLLVCGFSRIRSEKTMGMGWFTALLHLLVPNQTREGHGHEVVHSFTTSLGTMLVFPYVNMLRSA